MSRFAREELAILGLATQFLTRIPVPVSNAYSPERLAAAPRYYPLVGAGIGAFCAGIFALATIALPASVAIVLALAAGLLVTGAFHEDGLADTFDGFGARDRAHALAVMRDSQIGTYGTLALIVGFAVKAAALLALPEGAVVIALIVGHGLSRLSAVLVMASSRYVRDHGTGKPTANGISRGGLVTAGLTGAVLLIIIAGYSGVAAALSATSGAAIGHVGMRLLFERRLGGYTGDTLGATQQTSEMGIYLGLVACLSC